jgi:hypothetical protein
MGQLPRRRAAQRSAGMRQPSATRVLHDTQRCARRRSTPAPASVSHANDRDRGRWPGRSEDLDGARLARSHLHRRMAHRGQNATLGAATGVPAAREGRRRSPDRTERVDGRPTGFSQRLVRGTRARARGCLDSMGSRPSGRPRGRVGLRRRRGMGRRPFLEQEWNAHRETLRAAGELPDDPFHSHREDRP